MRAERIVARARERGDDRFLDMTCLERVVRLQAGLRELPTRLEKDKLKELIALNASLKAGQKEVGQLRRIGEAERALASIHAQDESADDPGAQESSEPPVGHA